jgi:hypothetical protein
MDEGTGIAEVIDVMKHPVVELAEGVEVGGSFTVRAKLRAPATRYSTGGFLVKILKPSGADSLQPKQGSLMEEGKFKFDSFKELKPGDRLEILISRLSS